MIWENQLKEAIEKNTEIIGTNETLKEITGGKVSKVFISSNTPEAVIAQFNAYKKVTDFELEILPINNAELGEFCKKQFNISVIGIRK